MKQPALISRDTPRPLTQDYEELRRLSIEGLEEMVTDAWDDFNAHDPGITILEALCYVVTEAAYRVSLPIADLLAPGERPGGDQAFYTAAKILPTEPLTHLDWRKLIIDQIEGVKNAWLYPTGIPVFVDRSDGRQSRNSSALSDTNPEKYEIRGLYTIQVEGHDKGNATNKELEKQVAAIFHEHRALCEDLDEVNVLRKKSITICTDIELEPSANTAETFANIVYEIEEYLSPPLPRYTLSQLIEEGQTPDAIFSGPRLHNGFILDKELAASEPRRVVYGSDLIRIIMCVSGVANVGRLELGYADGTQLVKGEMWQLPIDEKSKPRLSLSKSKFCLSKDLLPLRVNIEDDAYTNAYNALRRRNELPDGFHTDLPVPFGTNRPPGEYRTVQHEFPQAYGLAGKGLPGHATPVRHAQAQQLKGYLFLFDQLLADLLAQLEHVDDLLTIDSVDITYFSQTVRGLEDIKSLLHAADKTEYEAKIREIHKSFDNDRGIGRRNKVLDYFLARFGERFDKYTLFFEELLDTGFADRKSDEVLNDKINFLKEYPRLSRRRGSAFDFTMPAWNSEETIPGIQHRAGRMLGIKNVGHRNFADLEEEGFFVIENVLLRPRNDDVNFISTCFDEISGKPNDPYSYRVHIVVPSYAGRFGNEREFDRMAFRRFAEKTLREELPAHIQPKICFVDKESMKKIETRYRIWLFHRASDDPDSAQSNNALNALIKEMGKLQNEYPARKLHELGDEGDPRPIILNRSHLGNADDDPN